MDANIQIEIVNSRKHDQNDLKPLTMNHMIGIFILWSIGIAFSIVIFVGEIIIGKFKRRMEMKKKAKITFKYLD